MSCATERCEGCGNEGCMIERSGKEDIRDEVLFVYIETVGLGSNGKRLCMFRVVL